VGRFFWRASQERVARSMPNLAPGEEEFSAMSKLLESGLHPFYGMRSQKNHETKGSKLAIPQALPHTGQRGKELQRFGSVVRLPIALDIKACENSVHILNQILADTMTLRDLYKKHHWQVAGPTFYALHLMFDKHYEEQSELVDKIAERIQSLGGVSVAMSADVAEMTEIERPPRGREPVPVQISRLLEAHELILRKAREGAEEADRNKDDGTNDLLISDVIRTNEFQVWFLSQHIVETPLVDVEEEEVEVAPVNA
jgi:starvation-inducible DNA-binding protein